MALLINAHNLELTPKLQNYVEKKTGRLDRYMPHLVETTVDLTEQNARNTEERQIAQLTVRDRHGVILRAEERTSDVFAAVDAVVDKMYRQISRYRGKLKQRQRRGRDMSEEFADAEPLPIEMADEETGSVVREKHFSMRPMTLDEAIDQMDLLGHEFFVFFNGDRTAVNVVYKRRDGNYGVLQPDEG
jgi:putative sigma-54 modulation protein